MKSTSPESATPAGNAPQPRSRRPVFIRLAILGVIVLGGAIYVLDQKARPRLLTGPMIQIPTPDGVTIVWEMDAPIGSGSVKLELTDGETKSAAAVKRGTRYEATFERLAPATTFYYSVINDRGLLAGTVVAGPYKSKTPPPPETPFRFVAFGDSGNGSNTQREFARLIADARPDLVIHVGDLVYPAGAGETYPTHFYEPNAAFIRHAPFMPSLGNHDAHTDQGRPLLAHFNCPENGPPGIEPERCYWFDYGDARFVALDSNLTEEHGMMTREALRAVVAPWVRQVFEECKKQWKFAFFHHPWYTNSEHPPEGGSHMKEAFMAVFEDAGVDMVFCGHNHLYERTAPMRRDRIVEDGKGIVYIVTGAGGVSRYPEKEPASPYIRYYNHEVFSFTQVDLSHERLQLKQIDEHGKVIDTYTIEKPPRDDTPRIPQRSLR